MKLLVEGFEKEITVMDECHCVYYDISQGFILNETTLQKNDETGMYMMNQDEYEFWTEMAEMYENILWMEKDLDEDLRDEYYLTTFGHDLESDLRERLSWLETNSCEEIPLVIE